MKLNSAGNTEVSAYLALKEMGYDVSKNKGHSFVKIIRIPTHNKAIQWSPAKLAGPHFVRPIIAALNLNVRFQY